MSDAQANAELLQRIQRVNDLDDETWKALASVVKFGGVSKYLIERGFQNPSGDITDLGELAYAVNLNLRNIKSSLSSKGMR